MIPNGQLKLTDFSDGTSNTMALSEQSNFITDNTGKQQDWRATQPWGWYLGVKSPGIPRILIMVVGITENRALPRFVIKLIINLLVVGLMMSRTLVLELEHPQETASGQIFLLIQPTPGVLILCFVMGLFVFLTALLLSPFWHN